MSTKNNNPANAAAGNEAAERNDVLYQRRLKRAGLPRDPVALERKAPQQFEVAMIAATLTRQANATPTKLAAEGTSGECAACSTYLRHGDGDQRSITGIAVTSVSSMTKVFIHNHRWFARVVVFLIHCFLAGGGGGFSYRKRGWSAANVGVKDAKKPAVRDYRLKISQKTF